MREIDLTTLFAFLPVHHCLCGPEEEVSFLRQVNECGDKHPNEIQNVTLLKPAKPLHNAAKVIT